jgi:hypothetical protein
LRRAAVLFTQAGEIVTGSPTNRNRESRAQLLAIVLVTVVVMILGVLVVVAPDRFGVPRPVTTPVASPVSLDSD